MSHDSYSPDIEGQKDANWIVKNTDVDTLERIATVFACLTSIILFLQKWSSIIKMPRVPWPSWFFSIATIFSDLFSLILSAFASLPELDVQTLGILRGVIPFLFFPILWRYFSDSRNIPFTHLLARLITPFLYLLIFFWIADLVFRSGTEAVLIFFIVAASLLVLSACCCRLLLCFGGCCSGEYEYSADSLEYPDHLNRNECTNILAFGDVDCPKSDSCSSRIINHDQLAFHVFSFLMDISIVVVSIVSAAVSNGFGFPVGEFCARAIVFLIRDGQRKGIVLHAAVAVIFLFRDGQRKGIVRDFLNRNGVRIVFLWASFFYCPSISSGVRVLTDLLDSCPHGEFRSLSPLAHSLKGFDFLFAHEFECTSCESNMTSGMRDRLCDENHVYEGAAVIPLLIFLFGPILFGVPLVIFLEVRKVGQRIRRLCEKHAKRWLNII
jgi:hypothetical protein